MLNGVFTTETRRHGEKRKIDRRDAEKARMALRRACGNRWLVARFEVSEDLIR
jgi:hypothetical protein